MTPSRPVPVTRLRPVPGRLAKDATPTNYETWRLQIENELIRNWRTPLPPNPTPAQELAAWDNDVTMLDRAVGRIRRRAAEREAILAETAERLDNLE